MTTTQDNERINPFAALVPAALLQSYQQLPHPRWVSFSAKTDLQIELWSIADMNMWVSTLLARGGQRDGVTNVDEGKSSTVHSQWVKGWQGVSVCLRAETPNPKPGDSLPQEQLDELAAAFDPAPGDYPREDVETDEPLPDGVEGIQLGRAAEAVTA